MGINIPKKKKCKYQTLKQGKNSYKYQRNKIALFEFYSERISHSEDSACIVKIFNKKKYTYNKDLCMRQVSKVICM